LSPADKIIPVTLVALAQVVDPDPVEILEFFRLGGSGSGKISGYIFAFFFSKTKGK
jgi:hypothetical protein